MQFKQWLADHELTEISRWKQPKELMAMQKRIGFTDVEAGNRTRGDALKTAAEMLGKKNMPGLQSKLDNLSWRDADSETSNSFDKSTQPPSLYRGHSSDNPYISNNKAHASPWASGASNYGAKIGDDQGTTMGSQFPTNPEQTYNPNNDLERIKGIDRGALHNVPPTEYHPQFRLGSTPIKNYRKGTTGKPLTQAQSHETEIELDKHGKGIPALFRGKNVTNPSEDDMRKIYRPLDRRLKDIIHKDSTRK